MAWRLARWSTGFLIAAFAASGAVAQPSNAWTTCRKAPTRACVFAEAIAHIRDDAPRRDVPLFAVWERALFRRLSRVAEAKRDRDLFERARQSAAMPAGPYIDPETALRQVGAAQARSGFVDDAARTVERLSNPGAVPAEIAAYLVRSGRAAEADEWIGRFVSPAARALAWCRLAGLTRDPRHLEKAAASIRDIEDVEEQSAGNRDLAIALADLGHVDEALRRVQDIVVRAHQVHALARIAEHTRDPALLAQAKALAIGLEDREPSAWQAIVHAEIAFGRLAVAQQSLKRPEFEMQADLMAQSAGELAAIHWIRNGQRKAEAVLDDVLAGYAERYWGPARYALVAGLADAGRFDSARLMAFVNDPDTIDRAFAYIAVKQAESGAFDDAMATADAIQGPESRSPALARIASLLSQ